MLSSGLWKLLKNREKKINAKILLLCILLVIESLEVVVEKLRNAHDYSAQTAIPKTWNNIFTLNLVKTVEILKYYVGGLQSWKLRSEGKFSRDKENSVLKLGLLQLFLHFRIQNHFLQIFFELSLQYTHFWERL